MEPKTVSWPWTVLLCLAVLIDPLALGAESTLVGDLPRSAELGFRLRAHHQSGRLVVSGLDASSAAARAGLREGDVIVTVDGMPYTMADEGRGLLQRRVGGQETRLEVQRDTEILRLRFTPPPKPLEAIPGLDSIYDVLTTENGIRLRTILTKPDGRTAPMPAILFVQWLSCSTVELPMSADRGWERMMRGVAQRSEMVMMRTEKAGVGDSEGPPCYALDYDTELAHHRAALQKLRNSEYVDPQRIVLFGASMGSNLAPLVALNQDVAGLITWGGGAHTWYERQLAFERRALELGGLPGAEITERMKRITRFYLEYLLMGKTPSQVAETDPTLGAVWRDLVGAEGILHYGRPLAFHQQAQRQNWAAAWDRIEAPVLVLFGAYDWFETERSHELVVRLVQRRHPGNATFKIFPSMDHHFETFERPEDAFTGENGRVAAEPVVDAIVEWLRKQVRPRT